MNAELVSTMHKLLKDHSAGELLEALGVALQEYSSTVRMDYHEKDVGGLDYYAETMKVVNSIGSSTVLDVMAEHLETGSPAGQEFWNCGKRLRAPEE